jgi:hypothetical protein
MVCMISIISRILKKDSYSLSIVRRILQSCFPESLLKTYNGIIDQLHGLVGNDDHCKSQQNCGNNSFKTIAKLYHEQEKSKVYRRSKGLPWSIPSGKSQKAKHMPTVARRRQELKCLARSLQFQLAFVNSSCLGVLVVQHCRSLSCRARSSHSCFPTFPPTNPLRFIETWKYRPTSH